MIDLNKKKYSVPTLEFGAGDIRINAGFIDDVEINIGAVTFKTQEPQEIEKGDCFCDPKEDHGVELQFLFTKVESIDVVIAMFLDAKKQMIDFEGDIYNGWRK